MRAHRTKQVVVDHGDDLTLWTGNDNADKACKEIARNWALADVRVNEMAAARRDAEAVITRCANIIAWTFKLRPQWARGRPPRHARTKGILCVDPHAKLHDMRKLSKSIWRCAQCRREVRGKAALEKFERTRCGGDAAQGCHRTHKLDVLKGIVWCRSCGAYASRELRGLKAECCGAPPSAAAANVRRRLSLGLPPTTADYLDKTVLLSRTDNPSIGHASARAPQSPTDQHRVDAPPDPVLDAWRASRYLRLDARTGHGRPLEERLNVDRASDESASSSVWPRRVAIDGNDTMMTGDELSPPQPLRRRVTGKQAPTETNSVRGEIVHRDPSTFSQAAHRPADSVAGANVCRPVNSVGWSRRLHVHLL